MKIIIDQRNPRYDNIEYMFIIKMPSTNGGYWHSYERRSISVRISISRYDQWIFELQSTYDSRRHHRWSKFEEFLVDNGTYCNILYTGVLEKLSIQETYMNPYCSGDTLGFNDKMTKPYGWIDQTVALRRGEHKRKVILPSNSI